MGGVEVGSAGQRRCQARLPKYYGAGPALHARCAHLRVEAQKMVGEGVETIIGITRDVQFGPLVVFGLGGIYVQPVRGCLLQAGFRFGQPRGCGRNDRRDQAYSLLKGYRGKTGGHGCTNRRHFENCSSRARFSGNTEMDINPLRVHTKGASALDVKITIEPVS